MKFPLLLGLILACAVAANAQSKDGRPAAPPASPAAPPQAGAAEPASGPARGEPAPAPAVVSGPEAFWNWFAGESSAPGAYKAPEMPCSLVHDLNNANARVHQRRVTDRGQTYYAPFMISVGANPKLCMYTDAPTIPAEAMLPMSPTAFNDWIAEHDKDQAVRGPMLDYVAAADDAGEPVARLTRDRAKFWPAALKAVLADEAFRASLCAKLQPHAPSCPADIASKSPDELYALARGASPAR